MRERVRVISPRLSFQPNGPPICSRLNRRKNRFSASARTTVDVMEWKKRANVYISLAPIIQPGTWPPWVVAPANGQIVSLAASGHQGTLRVLCDKKACLTMTPRLDRS